MQPFLCPTKFRVLTVLPRSHTMTHFDAPGKQAFWEHCWKRRNCLLRAISPLPTVFSIHLKNFMLFSSNLRLSSADCFNLDQSEICRLVMGYCRSLWKTLLGHKKVLVTSIFYSFKFWNSNNKFHLWSGKHFHSDHSQILLFGKGLTHYCRLHQ